MRLIFILLTNLFFTSSFAQSWTISGTIKDSNQNFIPFASVFVKGSTKGVSANAEGYYKITVHQSQVVLSYSAIGFKSLTDTIDFTENKIHNIILSTANYSLPEVSIKINAEDPAYAIMRKVIANRKKHLKEIHSFQANVYIKGMQKLIKAPKKILGRDIKQVLSLDSNGSGIVYLSESQSIFSWQNPDKIKEEMVSSKVSGRNNTFSFNKASDVRINFYENLLLEESGLSIRGFVSPLADNALFYYHYKLLGKHEENGLTISKIAVLPKRNSDPVFRGEIYIVENLWKLYGVDVFLSKDSGIDFIERLDISQEFVETNQYLMPSNLKFDFTGNVFGFKFKGYFISFFSNYKINNIFPKGYFNHEIQKINKTANEVDSAYWANQRPIPLTDEEKEDYTKKDSIALHRSSKKYLDSIQRTNNKFGFKNLFLAYKYTDRVNKQVFTFYPLITSWFFNTVEGAGFNYGFVYQKMNENRHYLTLNPSIRYGFANRLLTANLKSSYVLNSMNREVVGLNFGSEITDLNNYGTMNLLSNTLNTLIYEENYLKLYQRNFIDFKYQRDLANGLQLKFVASRSKNIAMTNHKLFSIREFSRRFLSSNNPLMPVSFSSQFDTYNSTILNVDLTYTFAQKYITTPKQKIFLASKYPKLNLSYKKGLKNFLGSQVDFDLLSFEVYQEQVSLGLIGSTSFSLETGGFLNNNKLYYPDYKHFRGNNATLFTQTLRRFSFLDFYKYSTDQQFVDIHLEHNFGGFILNKIPIVRQLKFEEIIGINYLSQPNLPNYKEFYFGIRRLMFGLSYGYAFDNKQKVAQGIRYSYVLSF